MIMERVGYKRAKQTAMLNFDVRQGTSDIKAVEEVFKNNSYQRKSFKVEKGDRWIDMGANIGAFSVMANAISGNPVVSFEADETNAQITAHNIKTNGFSPDVKRAAVMPNDHPGSTVTFYVSHRPMALRRHSIYQPKKDFQAMTIPAMRFSDCVEYGRSRIGADCIKFNIEGVEIPIIRSLDFESSIVGIKKIVLEWSFDKEPKMAVLHETLARLRQIFTYVDCNKKINIPNETWPFYPPNLFIYAMR